MARRTSYPVSGKVVLVTGAARGIGAAAARELHGRGAQVALVGLEPERLAALAGELGDRAAWFEADVTDRAAMDAAVAGTAERFGGIDVVIANAGISPMGTVTTLDPAAFERTIEVNVLGVYHTVHAALAHVIDRRGYILPVASLAAAMHAPMMAPYAASKAAVEAFADALRGELAHKGVAVGCAYFSFIDTDMVREAQRHPATQAGGLIGKPAPLADATAAIVTGVETRARRVYAPKWVGLALWGRGVLNPLIGLGAARRKDVREAIGIAEANPQGPGSGPLSPRPPSA
ncbi:short-chain dehydrogenase/reductase [Capillimicrobium parvum]|uniref:3-phenylpropionate-dihydrodiol/cinnamic acid-dihydrodiol dehydrogenase n=1 Tax=Capillimicrobium parvum TaxID=2884022 RepID=A0A9E6XWV2_9ACTN|nr:short-chain dehydrogenase/reductase [Capillimicrobium parvum]UGS35226.1 3-phenylpropionate-dihydrodiol/cinnamic acid-dihydrodiol dehydrogenase [Capillimicrobium parvum]